LKPTIQRHHKYVQHLKPPERLTRKNYDNILVLLISYNLQRHSFSQMKMRREYVIRTYIHVKISIIKMLSFSWKNSRCQLPNQRSQMKKVVQINC